MIPRLYWKLFDLLALALAFWLAYVLLPLCRPLFQEGGLLRFGWLDLISTPRMFDEELPPIAELSVVYLAVAPVSLLALGAMGVYRSSLGQRRSRIVLACVVAPLLGLGVLAVALFGVHRGSGNRLFIFSFILLSMLSLLTYRLVLHNFYARWSRRGYNNQQTLLVGSEDCLGGVIELLRKARQGFQIYGYLGLRREEPAVCLNRSLATVSRLGVVDDLGDFLISQHIDEVVAVVSARARQPQDWVSGVVSSCDQLGITLRIVTHDIVFREQKALRLTRPNEDFPLACLELLPAYVRTDALFAKRLFDLVVSAILLVLLSPLLALIAVLIKLCEPKEPAIYPWQVVGQNGQAFTSYKFRTMVANADALKEQLMARNEMKGPVFKIADDPRVTPLGRTLRKFSLDELPQLWSVVKGDMSLVGPRPAGPHGAQAL